ncbi:transposase [Micromonospora sp. WMMB482]|nr:transposase [Micromonospora sp. WMMB482]
MTAHVAALREVTRAHRQTLQSAGLLARRLRSVLREYYPAGAAAWAHLPAGLTRPEARIVLTTAPTPTRAARLTQHRLETLLTAAGRSRLISAEAARLHELFHARALRQPADIEAAMGHRTAALLTQLDATLTAAQTLWAEVEDLAQRHPQTTIYRSFPGMGALLAARLLAEIGDDPQRFPHRA